MAHYRLAIAILTWAMASPLAAHTQHATASAPHPELMACVNAAAKTYHLPKHLLESIITIESRWNPHAEARNPDGSIDVGPMQVNSIWLSHPGLIRANIAMADLRHPCTNIFVGAWILSDLFRKHGVNWEAVGRYNSATPWRRSRYAWMVYNAMPINDRPPVITD